MSLVVTQRPLNIHILASLLAPDMEETPAYTNRVQVAVLNHLQSVLTVSRSSENSNKTIQFSHTSFLDFITDPSRCPTRFLVKRAEHRERMAKACFLVLRGLKRNICELKDPGRLNSEVDGLDELVRTHDSPSLWYACQHWHAHLTFTPAQSLAVDPFNEFFQTRLLFWIEVLSLLGEAHDGILAIDATTQWLTVRKSCKTTL